MTKTNRTVNNLYFLYDLMFLFPFFSGGFPEYVCIGFCVLLICILITHINKNKFILLNLNLQSMSIVIFTAAYLIALPFAVDWGAALVGFFKFLPLLPFMLIIMQISPEAKHNLLLTVPFAGAVLTVFGAPMYFFEPLYSNFYTNYRFHGGFGYANTFAIFLLCGLIITIFSFSSFHKKWIPPLIAAILITGLLLSGSRTVFIITAILIAALSFKLKFARKFVFPAFAVLAAAAAAYAYFSDNLTNVAHYLTSFLDSKTLVIRFVYYYDALPLIIKHPFGLGYNGYKYIQYSIQSTVYSVAFIHNEYLQFLLDIGWIPAILFFVGWIKSLISRNTSMLQKFLLAAIGLHIFLDFDLQFLSVFCIAVLCFDFEKGKHFKFEFPSKTVISKKSKNIKNNCTVSTGKDLTISKNKFLLLAIKILSFF